MVSVYKLQIALLYSYNNVNSIQIIDGVVSASLTKVLNLDDVMGVCNLCSGCQ